LCKWLIEQLKLYLLFTKETVNFCKCLIGQLKLYLFFTIFYFLGGKVLQVTRAKQMDPHWPGAGRSANDEILTISRLPGGGGANFPCQRNGCETKFRCQRTATQVPRREPQPAAAGKRNQLIRHGGTPGDPSRTGDRLPPRLPKTASDPVVRFQVGKMYIKYILGK